MRVVLVPVLAVLAAFSAACGVGLQPRPQLAEEPIGTSAASTHAAEPGTDASSSDTKSSGGLVAAKIDEGDHAKPVKAGGGTTKPRAPQRPRSPAPRAPRR